MRGEDVVVQAGEAHGVTRGAHFNLFPDQSPDSPAFDGFIVLQTGAFESVVRRKAGNPDFIVPAPTSGRSVPTAWALQTLVGEREDIRVFIPLKDLFIDLFHYIAVQMQETGKETMRIHLVEENEPVDLVLHVEDEQSEENRWVSFEPMDSTCQGYGLKRMPHSAPLEATPLYFILASAARFHWHLRRSSSQEMLARSVTVECTKLGEDTSKPYTYTTDPILVPQGDNLVKGGKIVIDLDSRPSAEHGFTITNHSTYPLYAALFYFDMSDLSISMCRCLDFYPMRRQPHRSSLPATACKGSEGFAFYPRQRRLAEHWVRRGRLATGHLQAAHVADRSACGRRYRCFEAVCFHKIRRLLVHGAGFSVRRFSRTGEDPRTQAGDVGHGSNWRGAAEGIDGFDLRSAG